MMDDRFDRWVGRLGCIPLVVMLVVMMCVSSCVMVAAFGELQGTLSRIQQTTQETLQQIAQQKPSVTIQKYLDQLEALSKGGITSSSISFLFQVFSVSMVSAGLYLVSQVYHNLKLAEKKTKSVTRKAHLIGPFAANAPETSSILGNLLIAYQTSCSLLAFQETKSLMFLLPQMRDQLKIVRRRIEHAVREKVGIERSHFQAFQDRLVDIMTNLQNLPAHLSAHTADLIDVCNDCLSLLRASGAVDIYEQQRASLCQEENGEQ